MATRSYICKENADGTYTGVYCHFDGYLTHNGAILLDCYNNEKRVDSLLSFGDISSLGPYLEPNPNEVHGFDFKQKNVCLFYGRDRNDKDTEAVPVDLSLINKRESWIDHCYVYGKDDKWRYFKCGHLSEGMKDLSLALDEEYQSLGFPRPEGFYGFFSETDIKQRRYEYEKSQESSVMSS